MTWAQGEHSTAAKSFCAVFKGIYLENVCTSYTSPKMVKNRPETRGSQGREGRKTVNSKQVFFCVFSSFWVRYSLCTRFSRYIPLKTAQSDLAGLGRAEKREHSPSREHRENVSYRLGKWQCDHGLGLEFRFPVSLPYIHFTCETASFLRYAPLRK